MGQTEEERKALQEDAIRRLEKEKGRELNKREVKTTMKALVMLNKSRSLKKQSNGENGEEVEKDSLNLSSEFITPSLVPKHTNGYYADKECSTPSTVPLGSGGSGSGSGEVAPSLGGRFHVNMLKDKYRANRNKGITNIFIDYSTIVR